jgi:hypothetical protein
MTTTAENFVLSTAYEVKYTNKYPVPIPEIIESLKAIEDLIKRSPAFIEKACGGAKIVQTEIYIDSLYSGSLFERFCIKFVFKDEDNYNKAKEVIGDMAESNDMIKYLLAAVIGGTMVYGIQAALPAGSPQSQISAYNNKISSSIVNLGGTINITEQEVKDLFDNMKDKKGLAKSAVNAIKPAKLDSNAKIEFVEFGDLNINQEFINESPNEYTAPVPDEKDEKYSNVRVLIYASDRDKIDSAWAGIVPGVVDSRVKFELAEGIDPSKLHGHTTINADITVTSRFIKSKKRYEPKLVELSNIKIVKN